MTMSRRWQTLLLLLPWLPGVVYADKCELLKTALTYRQEKAPRDFSGLLQVVVERVNRVLEGVVDVEVEWDGGDLQGRVGEHIVTCKVTRLASAVHPDARNTQEMLTDEEGRSVVVQCFHVPFSILDTNECTLPAGHAMHHQCHEPAVCVNTVGSYECICPLLNGNTFATETADDAFLETVVAAGRSPWELSYGSSSESSCPSRATTHGCCSPGGHEAEGAACRAAFRCAVDPCRSSKHNDCASNARCHRQDSPQARPNYECKCPEGLMGNGHKCRAGIDASPQPKLKFDGVTPTDETVNNNFFCGCHKPVIDACSGFPPCKGKHEVCTVTGSNTPVCACRPGYVNVEGYGCVDESPPVLRLKNDPDGDSTTRLKQGDVYKEHAVDIVDVNAEDYQRSLKITYSQPLPPGCLTKIGEFHVNYTVATPWTSTKLVRVTRRVIIEDIDECSLDVTKYESSCPELVPQCDIDSGAMCVNTKGSYYCKCPKFTTGDGFRTLTADSFLPQGYNGGTGCRDTSKPVIELHGPNPKIFKAGKFGGLAGIMGRPKGSGEDNELLLEQRKRYESDMQELIQFTSGAELCATHRNSNPSPRDCIKATDHTYRGPVDLTPRVKIGDPVKKSSLRWSIPYNVVDDAGNEAATVWRDIVVEEMDLYDLENRIRMEVMQEREADVREAVAKAVEQERKKTEQFVTSNAKNKNRRAAPEQAVPQCPACPECVCPDGAPLDESHCRSFCQSEAKANVGSCPSRDESVLLRFLLPVSDWIEAIFPAALIFAIYTCIAILLALMTMRWIFTFLFNRQRGGTEYYSTAVGMEGPEAMHDAVTYHRSPPPPGVTPSGMMARGTPGSAPPTTSIPARVAAGNGIFSPQENRLFGQDRSPFLSPPASSARSATQPTPGTGNRNVHYDDSIYETSLITPSRNGGQF